jgi:hypothetical protein
MVDLQEQGMLNLRIYKKINNNNFLAVDLERNLISTRSSYPEIFFENLQNGFYGMFPKENLSIKSFNSNKIIFKPTIYNEFFNSTLNSKEEIYNFIGIASNKKELLNLIEKN